MRKKYNFDTEALLALLENTNNTYRYISDKLHIPVATIYRFRKEYLPDSVRTNKYRETRLCKHCGKSFIHKGTKIYPTKGKFCHKDCYSAWQTTEANRGSNHPSWNPNGSHEKDIHRIRHSKEWRDWRSAVYERDKYKCKFCSSNKKLEPHHIYPRRTHPELIFHIDNGITLCRDCHKSTIHHELEFVDLCKSKLSETNLKSSPPT